jgi:hypothetical protein
MLAHGAASTQINCLYLFRSIMARHVTVTAVLDYFMDDEEFDKMTDEELLDYLGECALEDLASVSSDAIQFEIHV